MTILQMECFLEAARFSSFSLSAENLYMAQSTLSRQIQSLEEELHTTLFLRTNNMVRLSETGEALLPKIRNIYESSQQALREIHDIVSGCGRRFHLGVQSGQRLPECLSRPLRQLWREDNVETLVRHLDIDKSYGALIDGSVDMLLCSSETIPSTDKLEYYVLKTTPLYLAVHREHPAAGLTAIRNEEIGTAIGVLPYWILGRGRMGITEQPALEDVVQGTPAAVLNGSFGDMNSLLMMVEAGLAVTCVNGNSVLTGNPKVSLIPISCGPEDDPVPQTVQICLYWRRDNGNPWRKTVLQRLRNETKGSDPFCAECRGQHQNMEVEVHIKSASG